MDFQENKLLAICCEKIRLTKRREMISKEKYISLACEMITF